MAAKFALLLLVAVLGPSLSDAFAHLPDYDSDFEYGSNDVSTTKAVLDTENMYLRNRDRYSVLYLRHILKSTLSDCIFDTFDRADTNT